MSEEATAHALTRSGVSKVPFAQDEQGNWSNAEAIEDPDVILFEDRRLTLKSGQSLTITTTIVLCEE